MARPRKRDPLNVFLNGRQVGSLRRQASGAIEFQYGADWLSWEHTQPVSLSLPLREDRYIGEPVIAVFDNLLPDSVPIRRRIAERVRADGDDAYSLLAKVGRDCVGALQFLPDGVTPGPAGEVEGRPIGADYIAHKLGDLTATPLGMDEDDEFRISLAGAQEKTAFLFWKKKWHVPRGTAATTHILKPQIGVLPSGIDLSQSVENEYLCLKLTAAFGLPSANVTVADFKGNRALVVERFDRHWTRDKRLLRLPQEDLCQALSVPPSRKYESDGGPGVAAILDLLKGSDEPEADRRFFFKSQAMFWLLCATDGHAKNFSIFLNPGGRFAMTPLYDVISAQPAIDRGEIRRTRIKLATAIGDNRHYAVDDIVPRHFMQMAARCGIPASVIRGMFGEFLEIEEAAVSNVTADLPADFPMELARSVIDGLRRRLGLMRHMVG
ncbi:MAG: type II toxin-antitoxin system HipA family toxin [Alphaproteobacteria bacterium]|nr:type II toxin-antitoxin system HipA family toxin [Alphaproteobacteria bacterium]